MKFLIINSDYRYMSKVFLRDACWCSIKHNQDWVASLSQSDLIRITRFQREARYAAFAENNRQSMKYGVKQ